MSVAYQTPFRGVFQGSEPIQAEAEESIPTVAVSCLPDAPMVRYGLHDGEKFPGGYGTTHLLEPDYWLLRARSAELFQTNLYARGILRRLVTNEIATGLALEAKPFESVLGLPTESLDAWTDTVEQRFELWAGAPVACDQTGEQTFGELQAAARREALVCGDCLVVLRFDGRTRAPRVQLVRGETVQTPLDADTARGRRIVHGVELDESNRHVAYWIRQHDGTARRLAAWVGGRRVAWLLYSGDRRLDDVRGQPFLALMLQKLREIDRYSDATLRKAVLNSFLAIWIKRSEPSAGRGYLGGPAQRKGTAPVEGDRLQKRQFQEMIPGLLMQDLEPGAEPHGFNAEGTDQNLSEFERAIVATLAWSHEIPPSILMLQFSANYSASAAELNEFKLYLSKVRTTFSGDFCRPIYREWLVSETLAQRIVQPGLLAAWRAERARPWELAAWLHAEWAGQVKPVTDLWKMAKAMEVALDRGLTTHQLAAREMFGRKWVHNIKQQKRERELAASAGVPLGVRQQATPAEAQGDEEEQGDALAD